LNWAETKFVFFQEYFADDVFTTIMTQKCFSSTWIRKFKKRNKIFHKILSFLQKNSSHKKCEKVAATLLLPLSIVLSFTL